MYMVCPSVWGTARPLQAAPCAESAAGTPETLPPLECPTRFRSRRRVTFMVQGYWARGEGSGCLLQAAPRVESAAGTPDTPYLQP